MSWIKGFDFRATSAFVTDPTNCTYAIEDGSTYALEYPIARNGVTFGWSSSVDSLRTDDRLASNDPRLAGCFFPDAAGNTTNNTAYFAIDLPVSGEYTINIALGDAANAQNNQYLEIWDGSTKLGSIGPVSAAANSFVDATGTVWSASAWPTSNVAVNFTFTGTQARFFLGNTATPGSSALAHIMITQVGGTTYTETLTDTATVSDSIKKQAGKSATDLLSLHETVAKLPKKLFADSVSISDLFSKTKTKLLALLDAISPTDAISRAASRVLSETYSLSESLAKATPKVFAEAVTLGDSLVRSTAKLIHDSILIAESVTKGTARSLSESAILLSDIVTVAKTKLLALLDAINPRDAISRTTNKVVNDSISLVESIARAVHRTLAENVSISDLLAKAKGKLLALVDSLPLFDALHRSTGKTYSDVFSVTELIARQISRIWRDSLTLVDNISRSGFKAVKEAFTLADSLAKSTKRYFSEGMSVVDRLSAAKGSILNLIESIVLLDHPLTKGTEKVYRETISLIDKVNRALARTFDDAIGLADSLANRYKKAVYAVRIFLAEVWQRLWSVQRTGGNPIIFTAKDTDSQEDLSIDWSGALASNTIASSTWALPVGITLVQQSNTTTTATARISGGVVGKQYICENSVRLSSGQVKVQRIQISVSSS